MSDVIIYATASIILTFSGVIVWFMWGHKESSDAPKANISPGIKCKINGEFVDLVKCVGDPVGVNRVKMVLRNLDINDVHMWYLDNTLLTIELFVPGGRNLEVKAHVVDTMPTISDQGDIDMTIQIK